MAEVLEIELCDVPEINIIGLLHMLLLKMRAFEDGKTLENGIPISGLVSLENSIEEFLKTGQKGHPLFLKIMQCTLGGCIFTNVLVTVNILESGIDVVIDLDLDQLSKPNKEKFWSELKLILSELTNEFAFFIWNIGLEPAHDIATQFFTNRGPGPLLNTR